jgi:hypothetical protein
MNNVIGNRRAGKQVFYMLNGRVDVSLSDSLKINVGVFDVQIGVRGGVAIAGAFNPSVASQAAAAKTGDVAISDA